jgi:hypothetical protein
MVLLGRRAQRVIAEINATAAKLRRELLADISRVDLETCMQVLDHIRGRAEKVDRRHSTTRQRLSRVFVERNGQTKQGASIPRKNAISRRDGGFK